MTYNDVEFGEVTLTAGALLGTKNERKFLNFQLFKADNFFVSQALA